MWVIILSLWLALEASPGVRLARALEAVDGQQIERMDRVLEEARQNYNRGILNLNAMRARQGLPPLPVMPPRPTAPPAPPKR
jgi:hypothetical protein